jgi:hypothetical protein
MWGTGYFILCPATAVSNTVTMKHDQLIEEWEKEFDKKFVDGKLDWWQTDYDYSDSAKPSQVKLFLRSFAYAVRKNTIEKVEKMIGKDDKLRLIKKGKDYNIYDGFAISVRERNQFRSELRKKLQEMK